MATLNFNIQKLPAFGSYGEFSVGTGANQIRAQYLSTKIRPGDQGSWENQLATQMAPWREIFNIEELSFDELIQRDLDDSRVAHDLIPYLLGDTGQHARFFPPILAVLVPKRQDRSGIAAQYPPPTVVGEKITFGDLFDFEKVKFNDNVTPLGQINYNPQRSAVVIVDGQHRAMAVLALHRQLNKSWGNNPFAPFYDHIRVTPEAVAHIELPVCLLFFPDLHDNSQGFKDAGIDLVTVCREIFSVVNRQAKAVSKSRELLLDDEDFASFMMRRTLTLFKDRDSSAAAARIYSFAFGDSEADSGSQVVAGQLEFCSAVALHKMHAATGFGYPAAFNLTKTVDVTDGRNIRNPTRPKEILIGSGGPVFQALSRRSAKTHSPKDVKEVTSLIGDITDAVMLPFFDRLRPFAAHTQAMQQVLEELKSSTAIADPVQSKVRALLFDGSGNRNVFDDHVDRLKERAKDFQERGDAIPIQISAQLTYCDAVIRAIKMREDDVKLRRAYILFNIDPILFATRQEKDVVEADLRTLRLRARPIFDAVSTQAFQIGYLMAVLTQVEILLPPSAGYKLRLDTTKFVSALFLAALNSFFATSQTKHRTLSGYVAEGRSRAFETTEPGFRGLLAATNVRELSEKQWEFFRYMVFEIVHSKMASSSLMAVLNSEEYSPFATQYRSKLPGVIGDIETLRTRYFESAYKTSTNSAEFRREVDLLKAKAEAEGKNDEQIKLLIDQAVSKQKAIVVDICKSHLKASLGRVDTREQVLKRLVPTSLEAYAEENAEGTVEEANGASVTDDVDIAVVAEGLLDESTADEVKPASSEEL